MRKLVAAFGIAALFASGCMPPQTPTGKLTDSAYTIVEAARFGRMDIVLSNVQPTKQEAYADAHADWGGEVRILDIEYGGARLIGPGKAVVLMTIAWQRLDESSLRSSSIKQTWTLGGDTWMINEEVVASGDAELLKAADPKTADAKGKDAKPAPKKGS